MKISENKKKVYLHPDQEGGSASAGGGNLIGYVKNGDVIFPLGAQKLDYVKVDSNNTIFPFTIQGITFTNKNDQAIYTGTQWILYSFIVETNTIEVKDKIKESLSETANLQSEINEEVKIAIEDIRDKLKKQFKFVGFISITEPTGNVSKGDLWYNSTTLPELTDFPIQVKVYEKVGDTYQWSSTTIPYNPSNFDTWSNKNDNKGYYWFANMWNIIDANVLVDDETIEINNIGELQLKDGNSLNDGVKFKHLNTNSYNNQVANENNKLPLNSAVWKELLNNLNSLLEINNHKLKIVLINNGNREILNKELTIEQTIIQNNTNLIENNAVWKELLNNLNSIFQYDDTDSSKDVINLTLQNNNGIDKIDKQIDFNDKIVFVLKTQEIYNKTIDCGTF